MYISISVALTFTICLLEKLFTKIFNDKNLYKDIDQCCNVTEDLFTICSYRSMLLTITEYFPTPWWSGCVFLISWI